MALMVTRFGWRNSLFDVALIGLVFAVVYALSIKEAPCVTANGAVNASVTAKDWLALLKRKQNCKRVASS